MSPTALSVFVTATEEGAELPAPPLVLGLAAFGILVVLLLITLQFNKDR